MAGKRIPKRRQNQIHVCEYLPDFSPHPIQNASIQYNLRLGMEQANGRNKP